MARHLLDLLSDDVLFPDGTQLMITKIKKQRVIEIAIQKSVGDGIFRVSGCLDLRDVAESSEDSLVLDLLERLLESLKKGNSI